MRGTLNDNPRVFAHDQPWSACTHTHTDGHTHTLDTSFNNQPWSICRECVCMCGICQSCVSGYPLHAHYTHTHTHTQNTHTHTHTHTQAQGYHQRSFQGRLSQSSFSPTQRPGKLQGCQHPPPPKPPSPPPPQPPSLPPANSSSVIPYTNEL